MLKSKSILHALGEAMLGPATDEVLLRETFIVKKMLTQFTGQDILAHQRMTDTRKLAAMEFFQSIFSAAHNSADPRIGVIIVTRMIKNSLQYGICDVSAFAFAAYGSMLVHGRQKSKSVFLSLFDIGIKLWIDWHLLNPPSLSIKDFYGGYFFGNLALKIMNLLGGYRVRDVRRYYFTKPTSTYILPNILSYLELVQSSCFHYCVSAFSIDLCSQCESE